MALEKKVSQGLYILYPIENTENILPLTAGQFRRALLTVNSSDTKKVLLQELMLSGKAILKLQMAELFFWMKLVNFH